MPSLFKILVVDDDQGIIDVLQRAAASIFPQANFIPIISFDEAVDYLNGLKGYGPRLILLDLDLGSTSTGLDFLKRLRDHPKGRLLPVVIISNTEADSVVARAYATGANAFTVKPFSFDEWKNYVNQLQHYWFNTVTIPILYFDEKK